nr:hypothetical protein [Tanacetum cinerariifolium]
MSSFYESPHCHIYLCQICESNSHYGYECSQQVPLVYEPEPCYIKNFSDNNYSHDLPSLHPLIDHHCCYECGNSLNDFFCYQCTCKFYGNGAHVGYNFPAQVPSVQTLPSFPLQYPCCEDFGVTHEPYQCQPKNHDYYNEQNFCFDSNYFGFDQSQPQQYTVNHPIFTAHNDYLESQIQLNSTLAKITEQMTSITSLCEMACKFVQKKLEENQLEEERAAKAQNWKLPVCYDDDDDEERSNYLKDNIISGLPPCSAITPNEPVLFTEEPDNSLTYGRRASRHHSGNRIEQSNKDFSESNDEFSSIDDDSFSFGKIDYVEASPPDSELVSSDVMEIVIPEVGRIDDDIICENLLNVNHRFSMLEASNDNPIPLYDPIIFGTPLTLTPSGKDVLEKIVSKPLFKEEIIPMKIDLNPDNAESNLLESLRTHDYSLLISSKIDSLLDEFAGELTLLKSIPSRIDETDCDFEEDICLIEKFLYDNSSPCPPEEFVYVNYDAEIEYFSPSPILVKDNDSLMEEIDLFCTLDYPMSSGIKDDDYDSKRDILILKDLPRNYPLSFAEKESFHFDIPPFSRPPTKPPDGDTRILNIKMMGDIYGQKAFMHKLMITLASHQEKSSDLLSHRGLKAF